MDAKVGGTYRMSFTNFSTGNGHSFGGEYVELVPSELIRYTASRLLRGQLIGAIIGALLGLTTALMRSRHPSGGLPVSA